MLSSYYAPENDRWGRVFEVLVELSVDYTRDAAVPWRFAPPIRAGEPQREARFRELEAMVSDEVERGVDLLLSRQPIDSLSERARYWLGVRVDACGLMAAWMSTPDGFLPAPNLPIEQLTRWLLIHWWKQHGASLVTNLNEGGFPGHDA